MNDKGAAAREWRDGWPIVVASIFGMSLLGMGFNSVSTFFAPLEQAFRWTRAQSSSATTVYAGASILLGPVIGMILDRHGARRLALPGAALVGMAWALFSTLNGSIAYWLLLWLLLACVSQMIMVTVWSSAISKSFVASRGLALAVAMTGNGVAIFASPNLANYLIGQNGWRAAFVIGGLGWGSLVLLVCFFLLKDQTVARATNAAPSPSNLPGYTVKEGVRSAAFIKIVICTFIYNLFNMAMIVHLVPILGSVGLTRNASVWVFSLLGFSMSAGNIAGGLLTDRVPAKLLAACLIALPALSCLLLLEPTGSVLQRAIAVNIFGLAFGAQAPASIYVATRYLGLRNFGTLFGFIMSAVAVPTSIAPLLAGLLYDWTGSYVAFLTIGIPLTLTAALVLASLGRYPDFETTHSDRVIAA